MLIGLIVLKMKLLCCVNHLELGKKSENGKFTN